MADLEVQIFSPDDRVELMKSVRSCGVVLDAGSLGNIVTFDNVENCEIKFDDMDTIFLVKSKYLRKCDLPPVDLVA